MRASPFPVIHNNLSDPYPENPPPLVLRVFRDVNNSSDSRVKKLSHSLNFQSRSAFKLLKPYQKFDFPGQCRRCLGIGRCLKLRLECSTRWLESSRCLEGRAGEETDDIVQAGVEVDVESERIVKTIRTHKGKRKVVSSVSSGPDVIDEFLFHESSPPPAPSETSSFVTRKGHGTIISVDLPPIPPIPGVTALQMDFLSPEADSRISSLLPSEPFPSLPPDEIILLKRECERREKGRGPGKLDVTLSDIAANVTGNRTRDVQASLDICDAVLSFAKRHLRIGDANRRGGVLVLKHFAHPLTDRFRVEALEPNFKSVRYVKPDSSRSDSTEGYWLCFGWSPTFP